MATLTITVPDAVVTRIRAAFATPPVPPDFVSSPPATVQQVQDAIKAWIHARVILFELGPTRNAANQTAQTTIDTAQAVLDAEVW